MLIISNPNAGDKSGPSVLNEILLLLKRHRPSLVIDFKETNAPGDAGHIAVNYLRELSSISNNDDATILISGGDTTVHEVVDQLAKNAIKQPTGVILIPSGTANALYHSLFPPKDCETFLRDLPRALQEEVKSLDKNIVSRSYSVLFFLSNGSPRPLQSTRTSILNEQDEAIEQVVSCVVVSSCKLVRPL
jgi:diacylglycerol kinase family enzyme